MALQTKLKKGMSRVRVPPETDCGRSMEYSVITWHAGKIIRIWSNKTSMFIYVNDILIFSIRTDICSTCALGVVASDVATLLNGKFALHHLPTKHRPELGGKSVKCQRDMGELWMEGMTLFSHSVNENHGTVCETTNGRRWMALMSFSFQTWNTKRITFNLPRTLFLSSYPINFQRVLRCHRVTLSCTTYKNSSGWSSGSAVGYESVNVEDFIPRILSSFMRVDPSQEERSHKFWLDHGSAMRSFSWLPFCSKN